MNIDNTAIAISHQLKYLGVLIDVNLHFSDHISTAQYVLKTLCKHWFVGQLRRFFFWWQVAFVVLFTKAHSPFATGELWVETNDLGAWKSALAALQAPQLLVWPCWCSQSEHVMV